MPFCFRLFPILIFASVLSLCAAPFTVFAQELHNDLQGTYRARVIEVRSEETRTVPGGESGVETIYQELEARLLDGPKDGQMVIAANDYLELEVGDTFFLNHFVDINGSERYFVSEPDRRTGLLWFAALFVFVVVLFGGWQGARSLVSLALSFYLIAAFLLPTLIAGYSPAIISIAMAALILVLVMLLTHGFTRTTYVALGGTILAIFATGILAHVAIVVTRLSGFFSEEAIYLNLNTGGTLDMQGLFLGAVIIGVLGLLDDVAITQVHTVAELRKSGASGAQAFTRALRVGREHVSALVNTLALAYTGAALPVLLLFSLSEQSALLLVNREIFAAEIIRTTVGSIGLILTVPLTTWLAVWFKVGDSDRHESTT